MLKRLARDFSIWRLRQKYQPLPRGSLRRRSRINISKKRLFLVSLAAAIVCVAVVIIVLVVVLPKTKDVSEYQTAVVANGIECADIGMNILKKNGSVADAAIAVLFCEGIACPQSTGLGGGFVLTIYTKATGKSETLIARERAPLAATEDMFVDAEENASVEGGLAIAVPGELKGYAALYEKYGNLPWAELVQPSIDLCRNGHIVSTYLEGILSSRTERIYSIPSLREIFIDPDTNRTYRAGQRIKRLQLAETLEAIAKDGADALYNGTLTDKFVADIQGFGGIITKEDLLAYEPIWHEAVTNTLSGGAKKMFTTPAPSSGPVLTYILNILEGYNLDKSDVSWHRIIEAFKFAYAKRTDMGDPDFIDIQDLLQNLTSTEYAAYTRQMINDETTFNDYLHYGANFSMTEDHGTAHISIIAPNGDAIAATGTINYILGSMRRSQSTGIILNDEMDDFSIPNTTNVYGIPASPANYIAPGKIPMSSMCPMILVNSDGDVELAIGGAGGSKITTSVSYATIRHIWFNETILEAIHAKRIHHQLAPMRVDYEQDFDQSILDGLKERNHDLYMVSPGSGFAALTVIGVEDGLLRPVYDPRRGGSIALDQVAKEGRSFHRHSKI